MAKNVVITGASDGIGAALARRLVGKGYDVSIVGRSPKKTAAVAEELGVQSYLADFASLADVRRVAAEIAADHPKIDVLINNAGTWFDDYGLSEDGFERTLQVNALAPALLTELLLPSLTTAPSTVQWTSSISSRWMAKHMDPARIGVDDDAARENYKNMRVYGNAKGVGNFYVAQFQKVHGPNGISSVSVHPGMVATSFGTNNEGSAVSGLMKNLMAKYVLTTPDQSAERLQYFTEGRPGFDWKPGSYYQGKRYYNLKKLDDDELRLAVWNRVRELLELPQA